MLSSKIKKALRVNPRKLDPRTLDLRDGETRWMLLKVFLYKRAIWAVVAVAYFKWYSV